MAKQKLKYTQGPWQVSEHGYRVTANHSKTKPSAEYPEVTIAQCFVYCGPPGRDAEKAANAHLIAAAPQLLEAVKSMLVAADEIAEEFIKNKRAANWGIINDAYLKAEAAITKAERE